MDSSKDSTELTRQYARLLTNLSGVHIAASNAIQQATAPLSMKVKEPSSHVAGDGSLSVYEKSLVTAVKSIRDMIANDPNIARLLIDGGQGAESKSALERLERVSFAACKFPAGTGRERVEALEAFKTTAAVAINEVHACIIKQYGMKGLSAALREQAMSMQTSLQGWFTDAGARPRNKTRDLKAAEDFGSNLAKSRTGSKAFDL